MGNCLVTKLKGVVNNDNLETLGVLVIDFRTVTSPDFSQRYFRMQAAENLEFVVDGGSVVNPDGTVIQPSADGKYHYTTSLGYMVYRISNDNCQIRIQDKYAITKLNVRENGYFNLDQLQYQNEGVSLANLVSVDNRTTGHLENLTGKTFEELQLLGNRGTNISGSANGITISGKTNITECPNVNGKFTLANTATSIIFSNSGFQYSLADFTGKTNLATISLESCSNTTGDLTSLYNMSAVTSLNLRYDAAITGNFESYVENLWNSPNSKRTNLRLMLGGTGVTLNNGNYFKTNYSVHYVVFTNNGIELRLLTDSGTLVASYDGSSWSYPGL